MTKSPRLEEDKNTEENITKNKRNLFRLKKTIKNKQIKPQLRCKIF